MPSDLHAVAILFCGIFWYNIILTQFLGVCPLLYSSRKLESAVTTGLTVTFMMTIISGIIWILQVYVIEALNIAYMQTLVFVLAIAGFIWFLDFILAKVSATLHTVLSINLTMLITNCVFLGIVLQNSQQQLNFLQACETGCAAGLGFLLVSVLFAGVQERLSYSSTPAAMQGIPIALLSLGLISVALYGLRFMFSGLLGIDPVEVSNGLVLREMIKP